MISAEKINSLHPTLILIRSDGGVLKTTLILCDRNEVYGNSDASTI